jgi:hypothetical protein
MIALKNLLVKEMSRFTREEVCRLQYCMYKTFLRNPRLYYDEGARACHVVRNTFARYWKEGLENEIFFLPQIRSNVYSDRKEYIYLIQNDAAHELYEYYKKHPDVIYLAYTLGKFDLLMQTMRPLEVVPNTTLFHGCRGNYFYPKTPFYSFVNALERQERILQKTHTLSTSTVTFPEEPKTKGSSYGWRIFPCIKYNLRATYTSIVKKLGISFESFHKGFNYLLSVCTVLLPYYPLGFQQYSQHFFVFWTDYEDMIREFFSLLPCHVSIVKVNDALLIYASIKEGGKIKFRFLSLCYRMLELGLINRFWMAIPVHHWIPDV